MTDLYYSILKEELVIAQGCTEPVSIAFACAKLKELIGKNIDKLIVHCSPNIVKNVKSVTIPNSNGMNGIAACAALGFLGGKTKLGYEVLAEISDENRTQCQQFLHENKCVVKLLDTKTTLHLIAEAYQDQNHVSVEIKYFHTFIYRIVKNGEVILSEKENNNSYCGFYTNRKFLKFDDIYQYSLTCDIEKYHELLKRQIDFNMDISEEGFLNSYGVSIGKILLSYDNSLYGKIKAYTASASETRMCGCAKPVMTNSGSGNQGLTCSIPLVIYAKEYQLSEDKLFRGLILSNLLNIYIKTKIGRLSAFCGAVSAACAALAAITFLATEDYEKVKKTIYNTLAVTPGIICDGAKASCAVKISTALEGSITAYFLALEDKVYKMDSGILKSDLDETIDLLGILGQQGMDYTDKVILDIMLDRIEKNE